MHFKYNMVVLKFNSVLVVVGKRDFLRRSIKHDNPRNCQKANQCDNQTYFHDFFPLSITKQVIKILEF